MSQNEIKPRPRPDRLDSPISSAGQKTFSIRGGVLATRPHDARVVEWKLDNCFWGRCPGCNPPSVLSSIRLIGEPAPPAEDHRRLLPLSHRCRDPFHPQPGPPSKLPGRGQIIVISTGQGLVSAPPHRLSPGTSYGHNGLRHVGGVSSRPRPWSCNCSPARRLSTLGDWGSRAERLDRSLDAYTPIPSTPSSMGALVTVPQRRHQRWNILDWNGCLFSGEVSGLDAFSPYPR